MTGIHITGDDAPPKPMHSTVKAVIAATLVAVGLVVGLVAVILGNGG